MKVIGNEIATLGVTINDYLSEPRAQEETIRMILGMKKSLFSVICQLENFSIIGKLEDFVIAVFDEDRRPVARDLFAHLKYSVLPEWRHFRPKVINNDPNEKMLKDMLSVVISQNMQRQAS